MEELRTKLDELTKNLINSLEEYPFESLKDILLIQILFSAICFIFKKGNLILNLILFLIAISLYIILKNKIEDEESNQKSLIYAKLSLIIFTISIANGFIFNAEEKIHNLNPNATSRGLVLIFLIDTMILLMFLLIFSNEHVKSKILEFHQAEIKNIFKKETGEEGIKPGDAVIGYSIDDGKPVVLPLNDRYLSTC